MEWGREILARLGTQPLRCYGYSLKAFFAAVAVPLSPCLNVDVPALHFTKQFSGCSTYALHPFGVLGVVRPTLLGLASLQKHLSVHS